MQTNILTLGMWHGTDWIQYNMYIYVRTKEYKHWSTIIKETCDY